MPKCLLIPIMQGVMKSLQCRRLSDRLAARWVKNIQARVPGATGFGSKRVAVAVGIPVARHPRIDPYVRCLAHTALISEDWR
jgi:hypothetical protein